MRAKFFNLMALFFISMTLYAQQKIIGGTAIDISQRPYQAAIFVNGQFVGGGVIISNQWILTAAHVVHNQSASSLTVSTGYTNLNNDSSRSSVSQIYEHPNYISDGKNYMPNDIALVKLTSPLTFGSTRKPIRISSATTYSIGTTATVSGWGSRSQSSPNIASLNQLYKTTGTINKCNSSYVELKASTTSAYKGDSGGPLTISDSKDLLIGIVCGGKTSNPSSEPSVYTNVGVFYSWILSHVPSLYTISGADLLSVGSTYTYTITPVPTNSDISLSSNLSLVSLSGETLKVKSISNGRAYININSGSYVAANKPLWVGVPIVSGITYNGSTLTAETFGGNAQILRTEWTIGGNVFTAYDKFISSPYSSGTYTVSVKATNSCGTGSAYTTQISFSDRGTYSLTVESSSRIVTVTPVTQEHNEAAFALAGRKSATNATIQYVLADLTTGSLKATGYLPESGGTLDFSNVSPGMYVFKLYTSTGAEETFKISLK